MSAAQKTAILAQVGHFYFGAVGQSYVGANTYQQNDLGLIEMTGEPLLDGIADDPRFKAFLQKMNIPDVWQSADQVRRDGPE